jgi:hypothetical protein
MVLGAALMGHAFDPFAARGMPPKPTDAGVASGAYPSRRRSERGRNLGEE